MSGIGSRATHRIAKTRIPRASTSAEANFKHGRERVLDVAEGIIRRIGYRKTNMDDIAGALGMSRANVYRFFSTKYEINESVCARIIASYLSVSRKMCQISGSSSAGITEVIAGIYESLLSLAKHEPHFRELLLVAADANWDPARAYFEDLTGAFETTIRQGLATGEFDVKDPSVAARCVMASMMTFVHPCLVEEQIVNCRTLKDELDNQISFVLRALGKV